jgi:hypothetical protein
MTSKRVFCFHTRQIPLGVARAIAIPEHILGILDTLPQLPWDEPLLPILLFHAKLSRLPESQRITS